MRAGTLPCLPLLAAGLFFCLFAWLGPGMSFCTGSGCEVYREFTFLGVSFYCWGAILFAVLAFGEGRTWFKKASMLALAADVPLLFWQAMFVPCSNCLIVSAILTLNACLVCVSTQARRPSRVSWGLIFMAALLVAVGVFSLVKEKMEPWGFSNSQPTTASLYFSPSCGPCLEHIAQLHMKGGLSEISLVPVSRSDDDRRIIYQLGKVQTQRGFLAMVEVLLVEPGELAADVPHLEGLVLDLRLNKNLSKLISQGGFSLPWMVGRPHTQLSIGKVPGFTGWNEPAPVSCSGAFGCGVLE